MNSRALPSQSVTHATGAQAAHETPAAQAQQRTVEQITASIGRRRFRFANEKELQRGIAEAFGEDGIPFEPEMRLAPGDVVDFMVGDVAVEVKIDGPLAALTRQLDRYAEHDRVKSLVVISSRRRLTNLPRLLRGKDVHAVLLTGGLL